MTKPTNQREYREEKAKEERIKAALAQSPGAGHVVLKGGTGKGVVEAYLAGDKIKLPADEKTPKAANPDLKNWQLPKT